jgi:hypothetical protein
MLDKLEEETRLKNLQIEQLKGGSGEYRVEVSRPPSSVDSIIPTG